MLDIKIDLIKTHKVKLLNDPIKNKYELKVIEELLDIYQIILDNPELVNESDMEEFENNLDSFVINLIFTKHEQYGTFIMEIHSGAGGDDAQDWVKILSQAYISYFDKQRIKYKILDITYGNGGFRSIVLTIYDKLFKFLGEKGVHRLVRISPFSSNNKRHTSFLSVNVYPYITVDHNINIAEKDLRIDTFRASGAGGQHVNKTDSAVRITHIPSGIVVQCQQERSQHQNKQTAMNILYSKLLIKKQEESEQHKTTLSERNEWGQHFRSYVFDPYQLIKDTRTGEACHNLKFLSGEIEHFLHKYLIFRMNQYINN